MAKCLAQGHKRRNRRGKDSNPHSENSATKTPSPVALEPLGPRHSSCLKRRGYVVIDNEESVVSTYSGQPSPVETVNNVSSAAKTLS